MDEEPPPTYESIMVCAPPSAPVRNPPSLPYKDSASSLEQPTAPDLDTAAPSTNPSALSVSFPPLNHGDIKRACSFYAGERCCYGFGFVDSMTTEEVNDRIAYHYTLESYGEKRETAELTTTINGTLLDGPNCGRPPNPWDIPVTVPRDFANHRATVEIPHTAYTRMCPKCQGKGTTRCNWCLGVGGKGCLLCMFNEEYRPCSSCKYSGRRCIFCNGRGRTTCKKCEGPGQLRSCKILIVTWTNHVEHFVSDTLTLPSEEIMQAEGKVMLTEEDRELSPIVRAPEASVNVASATLMQKHRRAYRNELIVKQRHTLRAVPFTQIRYQWKDKSGEFYVYGTEMKAHFDDYPQQCCCCAVM